MKIGWTLMVGALVLSSCSGGKGASSSTTAQKYLLTSAPWSDENRASSFNEETLKSVPRVLDLKPFMTSAKNQGDRGTCTFFAGISLVESAIKRKMSVDVNLSEEYFNYVTKSNGYKSNVEGSIVSGNFRTVRKAGSGFILEKDLPYQPTWFGLKTPCLDYNGKNKDAPKECFSHEAPVADLKSKIIPMENFDLLYFEPESTNELIEVLADRKEPMSIGVPLNYRGWSNNGEVIYTEEMRQECINDTSACGAHEIVLTGYDLDKKVFFFKNSWGKTWGQDGFGTIAFDVIDKHAWWDLALIEIKENAQVTLPADLSEHLPSLEYLTVKSAEHSDHSLEIKSYGRLENINNYAVVIDSTLVRQSPYTSTSDHIEQVRLTPSETEEYGTSYVSNGNFYFYKSNLDFLDATPNVVQIGPRRMNSDTVNSLRNSTTDRLLLRTEVSIYTDDDYKVLKRVDHTLNY